MLERRWAHNRESTLIGGGTGQIVRMIDFSPFCFFGLFYFLGGEEVGVGRVKSNYYNNRLKLRLSFPRIVDDYPSNSTKYL